MSQHRDIAARRRVLRICRRTLCVVALIWFPGSAVYKSLTTFWWVKYYQPVAINGVQHQLDLTIEWTKAPDPARVIVHMTVVPPDWAQNTRWYQPLEPSSSYPLVVDSIDKPFEVVLRRPDGTYTESLLLTGSDDALQWRADGTALLYSGGPWNGYPNYALRWRADDSGLLYSEGAQDRITNYALRWRADGTGLLYSDDRWHVLDDFSLTPGSHWHPKHIVSTAALPCLYGLFRAAIAIAFILFLAREGMWIRLGEHQCPNCGYDLRASGDACPECGQERQSTA